MKKLLVIFSLLCLVGCFPTQKDDNVVVDKNVSQKNIEQKSIDFTAVKPIFKKEIENWTAHRNVNSFLEKYQNISPNEALNNALELEELVETLKDSIKVGILKTKAFQARVNVLHNESLRLSDMTRISAIKASEVNEQVKKIVLVFSSINDKINTVFTQKKFEDEIDVKDFFIGLDSTRLDTTTLKLIKKNNQTERERKQKLFKARSKQPLKKNQKK